MDTDGSIQASAVDFGVRDNAVETAAPDAEVPPPEACNGRDDDQDGRVDESVGSCELPAGCQWLYRGHQIYVLCSQQRGQAEARQTCLEHLTFELAVPETCAESEWIYRQAMEITGIDHGCWLGLRMNYSTAPPTVSRLDDRPVPLPEPSCWSEWEPNNVDGREHCVQVVRTGWNDIECRDRFVFMCEAACRTDVDQDGDGENACVDCDDRDPDANSGAGALACP